MDKNQPGKMKIGADVYKTRVKTIDIYILFVQFAQTWIKMKMMVATSFVDINTKV